VEPPEVLFGQRGQIRPVKAHRPGEHASWWVEKPGGGEGDGRLAASRLTGNAEDLACLDGQAHAADGNDRGGKTPSVADGEVGDLGEATAFQPLLKRGLAISSTAKLSSPKAVPRSARHKPGTSSHTHSPKSMASPSVAQVEHRPPGDVVDVAEPDELEAGLGEHRERAAPKKFETMIPSMFGTMCARTMCQRLSPEMRDAWTNGRSRRAMACARRTFAPTPNPLMTITPIKTKRLPPCR